MILLIMITTEIAVALLKGHWHKIFDQKISRSFFTSGTMIRDRNSFWHINSKSRRKSILKWLSGSMLLLVSQKVFEYFEPWGSSKRLSGVFIDSRKSILPAWEDASPGESNFKKYYTQQMLSQLLKKLQIWKFEFDSR